MAGMDAVPREVLKAAYERRPIHLLRVPLGYAYWAGAAYAIYRTQDHAWAIPIGIACALFIALAIRGLGAIGHDAVHGNLSRSKTLSYLISLVCWAPTGMSVTLYANYHLHHHKITNRYPDIDNFVVTDYTRNPFFARVLLYGVYSFGYPIYFLFSMMRYYVKRLSFARLVRANAEVAVFWGVVAVLHLYVPMRILFFAWWLPFILGSMFASVTSMIEHYEMPASEDDAYSSRTYSTKATLLNFLWNNVSFHNEHHKYPGIPFYNLKSFHKAAYPHYDDRVKSECYGRAIPVALKLYGRIWNLDIAKLDAKYAQLNRTEEKAKLMKLPGIQPGAA